HHGVNKEQYLAWKKLIPYLYDWFANHNLTWPSLSCRWGPVLDESPLSRRQQLYLSEQTDGSVPNKLLVVTAEVARPRVAAAEHITGWTEHAKSPHISHPSAVIYHPGEVNRLRELPSHPHLVATHTDSPLVFLWDVASQPRRSSAEPAGAGPPPPSLPDLTLSGHAADAPFALAASSAAPRLASGGKDAQVLVWDLGGAACLRGAGGPGADPGAASSAPPALAPTLRLLGSTDTVEDVAWLPGSDALLASVGDDRSLRGWDCRAGGAAYVVAAAHSAHDIHALDWSGGRPELVATGAADGSVRVWDVRRLSAGAPLLHLAHHAAAAACLEWSPAAAGALASGGEDGLLCLWDVEASGQAGAGEHQDAKRPRSAVPPQLVFQHAGHRSPVVDFQWNPADPWTLLSVSDDVGEQSGGGTLQLWRVSDLITRPEEEVLAELEYHRSAVLGVDGGKAVARTLGLLPDASPVYDAVWGLAMPMATALVLMEADMTRLFRAARDTLLAFLVASAATMLATLLAFALWQRCMGPHGASLASALCASYIGGSINFAATAAALQIPTGPALGAAMAADNVAMAGYIAALMAVPVPRRGRSLEVGAAGGPGLHGSSVLGDGTGPADVDVRHPGPASTPLSAASSLALAATAQLGLQLGITLLAATALRLPRRETLVAANAAVGGPGTAAAMAAARGWHDLVEPGVLAGTLGYAVGTAAGIAVSGVLRRGAALLA
ncbi:hypothetical protein APUTEX25_003142, partial [Auxenochlorella protothecoides]